MHLTKESPGNEDCTKGGRNQWEMVAVAHSEWLGRGPV